MLEVIVGHKNKEAEGIYSYELVALDGTSLPPFSAGSHVDVHLPNGLVRQYSLYNSPDDHQRYQIAVLLDPASRGGSSAMHDLVQTGSCLRISEPRNLFPLEGAATKSILFAGGIGITPILCMAERLTQAGARFELHYCSRTEDRTAFVERLRSSPFSEHVHLHFDDGDSAQKLSTEAVLASVDPQDHLYVCGPGGFMEFVLNEARRYGWTENQLHREYFSAAVTAKDDDGSFEVELASSGTSYFIPADRSVAEVLIEAGIDIPLSCEQGICGTCMTRVIQGIPDHRDMFMTESEHAVNNQFTPCCSRSRTPLLVLDI